MKNVKKYIDEMKERPEKVRKQYISVALLICMTVVLLIWVTELSYKISSINKEKDVVKEEVSTTAKPFSLLFDTAKDAYKNVKASALDASVSLDNIKKQKSESNQDSKDGKMIDLIQVEYIEQ